MNYRETITGLPLMKRLGTLALMLGCLFSLQQGANSQDITKIWEFSPYEVEVWYSFAPETNISNAARDQFIQDVRLELARTFRASWRVQTSELAPEWAGITRRNFREFAIDDLTENELTLVVALKHEETKTIRTLEAAIEKLDRILLTEAGMEHLQQAATRFSIAEDSPSQQLLNKCVVEEGVGLDEIKEKLTAAEIPCAMLPRNEISTIADKVRPLLTTIPWHTDNILKRKDKIMFLSIGMEGDNFRLQARELDCPMRFMGPTFSSTTLHWPHAARSAAHNIVKAFAPIARVEEADALTSDLLHRAGGLIVKEDNPARIKVGDVLQPIVRRDGKNGVPTLLQPLSWTFAAVTKSDGVKMNANVYTYSGGPGLQGRRNRRTQRVVLRVRPTVDETDIEVVVRKTMRPQSGSFVFQRHLLTGEFDELGRTDWRGKFKVKVPEENGRFLEARVRKARLLAKRDAQRAAAIAKKDFEDAEAQEDIQAEDLKKKREAMQAAEKALAVFDDYDPAEDKEAIPLNFPLTEIYIKNGNEVLAKLPMVPGLRPVDTAELNDDRRRLQTEAFVKGFQSDIISVIGLRNIMAARIRMSIKEDDLDSASQSLAEMREIPTYEQLAGELDTIQRVMLDEKRGAIGYGEKRKIDGMFQNTSDLLQKYLQDSLFQKSLQAVEDAGGKTVGPKKRETVGEDV